MSSPFLTTGSVTLFGFLYYPIFKAVHFSITGLRCINIVLIAAVSLLFAASVGQQCTALSGRPIVRFSVFFGIAISAFVQLQWLPLTPNYNWLNLTGILIFLAGACRVANDHSLRTTIFWSVVVGVGLWLTGLANPTSAVCLAALSVAFSFMDSKRPLGILVSSKYLLCRSDCCF